MRNRTFKPPSPALVISMIALIVALGGTSYAALNLPKNSVGTKQLKGGAVTAPKIKNRAVTRGKIAIGAVSGPQLDLKNVVVPQANKAFSAQTADIATQATTASLATNAQGMNFIPASGWQRAIQLAHWVGFTGNFTGPSSSFTFASLPTTLTTTQNQTIVASGSAALATSSSTATAAVAICTQPSAGGAITPMLGAAGTEDVIVTVNRTTFAMSALTTPGAGTWKVGLCVEDQSAQAIDHNDNAVGWAMVV